MTLAHGGVRAWPALAFCMAVALFGWSPAAALSAGDVFGLWQHPDNGSQVEIYACGEGLCARIAAIGDGQKTDDKNPDPEKRRRPIIGLVILAEAHPAGPLAWTGALYNRADGHSYAGKLTLKERDLLVMTGCTAVVICRSVTWRRVPAGK